MRDRIDRNRLRQPHPALAAIFDLEGDQDLLVSGIDFQASMYIHGLLLLG
jgi:hypothetical protein